MKTLDEWYQKYATSLNYDVLDLIKGVRREAFERCELEAYRADGKISENTGLSVPTGWGKYVAERIAQVLREEGSK